MTGTSQNCLTSLNIYAALEEVFSTKRLRFLPGQLFGPRYCYLYGINKKYRAINHIGTMSHDGKSLEVECYLNINVAMNNMDMVKSAVCKAHSLLLSFGQA